MAIKSTKEILKKTDIKRKELLKRSLLSQSLEGKVKKSNRL